MQIIDIFKQSQLPRLETEILLAHLLKKEREFLLIHPETKIPAAIYKKYQALQAKRLTGWSIAVLISAKEFYGLNFFVDKHVLVPRPETEMIVEEIQKIIVTLPTKYLKLNSSIIDLGTGSGAIIISLAKELRQEVKRLSISFKAVDISPLALKVAEKNARWHKQTRNIKFLLGNLLEPLINKNDYSSLIKDNLFIAANLPYLTATQIKQAPSIKREPRLALLAGRDGLKYYRVLFKQLAVLQKNNPENHRLIHILCEIDPGQVKNLKILQKNILPQASIALRKDLSGQARLALITIS